MQEKSTLDSSLNKNTEKESFDSIVEGKPRQEPNALPGNSLVTPQVIHKVQAQYPENVQSPPQESEVLLQVVVGVDGRVLSPEVLKSGGEDFDVQAIAAVKQWRFIPAKKDGVAIASRIQIPFFFRLDSANTAPSSASESTVSSEASSKAVESQEEQPVAIQETGTQKSGTQKPELQNPADDKAIEVRVLGERETRVEQRSSGDFRIGSDTLAVAPRSEGVDVLRATPGLYLGRNEGPAVAHRYMLRGFDADHGQDIEFRVGGLPINLPSHIHGQGYADLSFLLGEVVRELQVSEGVYDPRQGDFSVAGSIDVSLGIDRSKSGLRAESAYGAFRSFRQKLFWGPPQGSDESFVALQFTRSDGFGENRFGQSASGIFQHRFLNRARKGSGESGWSFRVLAIMHTARADIAGVLRNEDIQNKLVCFTCVYPFPTAQSQNASANRIMVGGFADYDGSKGANAQLGIWFAYDNFRIQSNFTGFLERSRVLENVSGRGDLIEQLNRTRSSGITARYRTAPFFPKKRVNGTVELGLDGRVDQIAQSQNLLDAAVRSQTWDRRIEADILGLDFGFWGDLDWHLGSKVRLRVGGRSDVLSYVVEDHLANFAPSSRPQDEYLPGFRRSAFGVVFGPRTSLSFQVLPWMKILAAYGEGYRSPQARTLEDGERAPYTKTRSTDMGLQFDHKEKLQVNLGGYYTRLSDDIAFEASEGRLERVGATQRLGGTLYLLARPFRWMSAMLSGTFVRATLLEPPPATAEDPDPAYQRGQHLPFVPPVVVRAELGLKSPLFKPVGGKRFIGRISTGFSALSPRPLPFGKWSPTVALLDASLGLGWGPLHLAMEVYNATNARYAAIEYNFTSDWNPHDGMRSRIPARHIAAGSPLSWMVSLGLVL